MIDNSSIKISVRNLVEFILCSGDIDSSRRKTADKEAMQAGSRMHRKIQGGKGTEYHAEYPLKIVIPGDRFSITVEGRADGIIIKEEGVTVDEIKGVYMDLDYLQEPVAVHKAQAMCYGYIYAKENSQESIGIQMTYCGLDSEQIKYFRDEHTFAELETWFETLISEYKKWAKFQYEWRLERQASIQPLEFPFPYREGQKKLAASVYRTIERNKKLFIQAPTGVGKTMSAIFPAVKAVGEGLSEKIFYLTAKTITRTVAKEAFDTLKGNGLRYKVATITAKDKLCILEKTECTPAACPRAKGHYDRVNQAVFDLINREDEYTTETILDYAERYSVCPFELCLDVSVWADAVICDYNYVFDPNVHLKRFFSEGVKGNYIFLVDEAHNLVDRAREMYSASLYKEELMELKRLLKGRGKKLESGLQKCNKYLLEIKRECDEWRIIPDTGHFVFNLMALSAEIEKFLEEEPNGELRDKVLEFYLEARHFLNIYDRLDDSYVIYSEHDEDGRFKLKLFCVNPATNLKEFLDKGDGTVFFSATLLPVQYYRELLSTAEDDYAVYAESPFSEEKRLVLIGGDVSSRYTRRSAAEYRKIAAYIIRTIRQKKGNYLIFFPSYRFMEDVYAHFAEMLDEEIRSLRQSPGMNEEMREEFLSNFMTPGEESLAGFCVMGGIFGEGIDLKYDSLIGTVIVGTGLPQVCNEREILKQYYDAHGRNGFEFAYLNPGMNKVLQAAGRVIRTAEDQGVILLLDERFRTAQYMRLFPREWRGFETCTMDTVEEKISSFWESQKKD